MDDATLLRYSRHLLLNEIGMVGQERIARARLLVIGAGGLGAPAALYLAAAGVGHLTMVDGDRVELGNLQRQVLHTTERVGQAKADSAAQALRALNPQVAVQAIVERAQGALLTTLVESADVVLDCSDNRATRYALNQSCHAAGRPLISGSANSFAGQLAVFDFRRAGTPCYACLFPPDSGEDELCSVTGVFGPLTGLMGTLQAGEALKLLADAGPPRIGQLLLVDALSLEFRSLRFSRAVDCPVCGADRPAPAP